MVDINNLTKLYYSIGEIADIFGVSQSQLRYWETEFSQLKPGKNNRGERRYTRKEIDIIQSIILLLKDKGFTIEGARKELIQKRSEKKDIDTLVSRLKAIKKQLESINDQL
jgi:DNA-binding transcriptional MerR regulator